MKTHKQHQHDKLRKTSMLFTQLGLVLALLIVYLTLELQFEKIVHLPDEIDTDEPVAFISPNEIFTIEREVKKVETPQARIADPTITFTTAPVDIPTTILDPEPTTNTNTSINSIVEVIEELDEEPVIFIALEEAPIFPGCEGLEKEEAKLCFSKKISQFVNKKFNTDIASELNITGKRKIFTQFTIDKEGKIIDVMVKAPHARLEKEALRVIEALPKMTPGKQHLKPVKVKYTLPIIFEVH
jgi:protein TonB